MRAFYGGSHTARPTSPHFAIKRPADSSPARFLSKNECDDNWSYHYIETTIWAAWTVERA